MSNNVDDLSLNCRLMMVGEINWNVVWIWRSYVWISVPSIVIPKGSRSPSRPDSPTSGTVGVPGGMPSLGTTRQGLGTGGGASEIEIGNVFYPNVTEADMIDGGNANPSSSPPITTNTIHRPSPSSCCSQEKSETENKNFRNRVSMRWLFFISSPLVGSGRFIIPLEYWLKIKRSFTDKHQSKIVS